MKPIKTSDEMVRWREQFVARLAERLHAGEPVPDPIAE
jgi:hypothetical protein